VIITILEKKQGRKDIARPTMSSRSAKIAPMLWKLWAVVAGIFSLTVAEAFLATPPNEAASFARCEPSPSSSSRFLSSFTDLGAAPVLKSLLKKPSKVLTVGVEYSPEESGDNGEEGSLEILSMKLRQQAKVSFIGCSDIASIKQYSAEQETARGNFPGPVPIIFLGDNIASDSLSELSEAGASAVVVDAGSDETVSVAESASSTGLETIWKVSTVEQAQQVLESTNDRADVFLLDDPSVISQITQTLPKSSLSIAVVHDPMQEDGAEIETGKTFKSMGCASVLVKKACVGDNEDIDYASFLVSGLTSKASSEFKFSGLTGSTNGHFGGIQSNSSVKWDRTRLSRERNDKSDDE